MFVASQSTVNLVGVGVAGSSASAPHLGAGDGGVPLSGISAAHEELPFELRALEIALDTVSQYLERLTGDLEAAAHPALDALTGKVGAVLCKGGRPAACRGACPALLGPRLRRGAAPPRHRRSTPATWSACGASRTGWCGSPRASRR